MVREDDRGMSNELGPLFDRLALIQHEKLLLRLARERGGCSDELRLCNHEQIAQVQSRRLAPVAAPA